MDTQLSKLEIPWKTKIKIENFQGWGLSYLLEFRSFDSAFFGDMKLVLLAGPFVDDGQSAGEVGRRRQLGGEMERVEGAVMSELRGEEVSGEHGQTAMSMHRRCCCIWIAWHVVLSSEHNNYWNPEFREKNGGFGVWSWMKNSEAKRDVYALN